MEQQNKPLFDDVHYERTAEGRLRFFVFNEDGTKRYKKLRIRKLTPRECFRLMDVDDKYIDLIQAAGISKSQQYKLAGNAIVVACMTAMFDRLFVNPAPRKKQTIQLSLFD